VNLQGKLPQELGTIAQESFWHDWHQKNYALPTDESLCYMFVYHPYRHHITLCGVRNMKTLKEGDIYEFSMKYGWNIVKNVTKDLFGDNSM
jgi:hypothetical protein